MDTVGRGRYSFARRKESVESEPHSPVSSPVATLPIVPIDREEHAALCKVVEDVLARTDVYTIMGDSTQVVVVEDCAPLHVAFIAAQETKATSCAVWSSKEQRFIGVLPSTEYVKILLKVHSSSPEMQQKITEMTIYEWLVESGALQAHPEVVMCRVKDPLDQCFEKMNQHRVRRALVVAPKNETGDEGSLQHHQDLSLVAILTQEALVKHLALTIFHVDHNNTDGSALPNHVQTIIGGLSPGQSDMDQTDASSNAGQAPPSSHRYRTIFDVPFNEVPFLGQNRNKNFGVKYDTVAAIALQSLLDNKIHSVPIINDSGIVIDVVSRSDVLRMETNGEYNVNRTVREAVSGFVRPSSEIYVFHETDTIRDIFLFFATKRVRELYLVDPKTDVLLGQLSMSELLKFLFNFRGCEKQI